MSIRLPLLLAALALSACSVPKLPAMPAMPSLGRPAPAPVPLPPNVTMTEPTWYSEQVRVSGRLFQAPSMTTALRPGVILAPDRGQTAASLDAYAIGLASQGVIALVVDYRGWGRSGAELYLGERVDAYDKMRFSEQTPTLVYRRGRVDPDHQVQDLRNAITYLQSERGVDPARIGVVGVGLGGGHAISILSMDARVKAGVGVTPLIPGQGEPQKAFLPTPSTQAEMIRLAREGAPPRTQSDAVLRNAQEARLALAEYKPFWRLASIPASTAIRFILAENDEVVENAVNARAAMSELKGPRDVAVVKGSRHDFTAAQTTEAARLAAEWMKEKL
jgi:dienelactone hydrolase